jgi:hypothetical protein
MVVVWSGAGLGAAGAAGALVEWVGLDRANAFLGIPAAVAAVLGLGVAVYGVVVAERSPGAGGSERRVRQRATASGRGRVSQVGGHAVQGPGFAREGGAVPVAEVEQRAQARGDG